MEEELPLNTAFDENIHSILFALPNIEHNNNNICIGLNIFTYDLELYTGAISHNKDKSFSIEIRYIFNGILCSDFISEDIIYSDFISDDFYSCIQKSPYELKNVKNLVEYNININNVIYTCNQVNTNGYCNLIFSCIKLNNREIIKSNNDYLYERIYINILELKKFISIEDYDKLNSIKNIHNKYI